MAAAGELLILISAFLVVFLFRSYVLHTQQGTEWLLASHDPVTFDEDVAPALARLPEFDTVYFKFEPVRKGNKNFGEGKDKKMEMENGKRRRRSSEEAEDSGSSRGDQPCFWLRCFPTTFLF